MEEDIPQAVYQLQGLVDEMVKIHDDERLSQLSEKVLQLLKRLPVFESTESKRLRAAGMQLYTSGIALWNKTVALSHAGAIAMELNAQMRHVACSLVVLTNPMELSEANTRKRVSLAAKTGRAWLDCGNPTMADTSLTLAIECCEKLRSKFPQAAKETSNVQAYFRVLCFKAEAAVGQDQHEIAKTLVQQAKELLHSLQTESGYLSMLCYNFGLDEFQKEAYEHAISWLKESYEIGRSSPSVGAIKQARTLRLLANTYLEWNGNGCWQKALNAVDLANSEHSHPAGLLLKTNIFLKHDNTSDRLPHVFEDVLRHPDLQIDTALATIRMAKQNSRSDLAFRGVQLLTKRYQHSPDLAQIHLLHLELLLENDRGSEAKQLVEDCITAHNTGDPLDGKYLKHFHLLLWEQAYREYERSEFKEAVMWYNYSLSLFPNRDGEKDKNIAKLQRNRCSCYIQLGEYDRALEAINQSKGHEPQSSQTHFLAFRLALLTSEEQEAAQSLGALADSANDEQTTGLICLAAQQAFERNCHTLAVVALEKLVERSSSPQQAFTALRCLVRIKLTTLSQDKMEKMTTLSTMLGYINSATAKLPSLSPTSLKHAEAGWFMKVTWNLGLQCGECYHEMARLFTACYQLSTSLLVDNTVLQRQKTCLLMAAAAGLQVVRNEEEMEEKSAVLKGVLDHVSKCRSVCKQLEVGGVKDYSDPTHSLLSLYEFESKLKLGHREDLEGVIESITRLQSVEPKTFEIIAALSIKEGVHSIGIQALKLGILRHRQSPQVDGERLSKCYHSLVDLVMGSESSSDMASKEQAWNVLDEVLNLVESRQDKGFFPEIEVLWFLAKAWNCGIHLYSMMQYKEAEQWCSMGMNFLKHLSQLRDTYQEQMTMVYTEVIQKVKSNAHT